MYTVNLAWLKSSTTEPQQIQYFKLVFLVLLNVPIRMAFAETVTYCKSFKVEKFCDCKTKLQFTVRHSWLDGCLVWPKPTAQTISLERFHGYQSIHKNHKTYPPQMICNIHYFKVIAILEIIKMQTILYFYWTCLPI